MPLAVIHDNHLKFAGNNYFRGNAPSVRLGDHGKKKSPVLSQNYLAVQDHIPAPKLESRTAATIGIDFGRSTKADIELNLKIAKATGSIRGGYEQLRKDELKLVKIDMNLGDVKDAVNRSPKVLDALRSYGSAARVAHQVFVVMEASTASRFDMSGALSFSMAGQDLKMTTSGTKVVSVVLDPGAVYAYLLCKPKWNSGKTQVLLFEPDQWGPS